VAYRIDLEDRIAITMNKTPKQITPTPIPAASTLSLPKVVPLLRRLTHGSS
jgi:hypothetical protein